MRGGPWWWMLVLGGSGISMGAEPDPEAVRRLMEKYEREAAEEAAKQAPAPKPRPKPAPAPQPKPKPAPAVDHDLIAWQSAEKCGTAACFEAYLEEYPKGRYARMARARLKPAESAQSTASRPPVITSTVPEERPRLSSFTDGTIKIAIAGPTTGPVAQYGDMQIIGAKMAVEQINAKGGVNGKKLEAVIMDDACEPKQAVAVANQIVNQKIKYVVGHLCSNSTQPASELYEDQGILMITPAATNPAITQQGHQMVFRTIGTDDQQGPTAGKYIAGTIKPKKLAILHDKQQYGQGIAEEVDKTVKAAGITPALFEGINRGQTDFSALITRMKNRGVDFVYYGGFHPELGLLLRQSREQGFYAKFMGPEGVGNSDISTIAGAASEGLLVTLPADFSTDPANTALVRAFKSKNQDPTGPFVMPAYAAVQIIAEAIRGAQTEDPVKLAGYIRKNSFNTSIGSIAFKKNGDLREFQFVVFYWHADATKSLVR